MVPEGLNGLEDGILLAQLAELCGMRVFLYVG